MVESYVKVRHYLHKNPELSFEEKNTTKYLIDNINKLSDFYGANIVIHRPLETGLVVEYTVCDSEYLLYRADIDALPVQEKTSCEFSSTNRNMHACGHDIHMSCLYGFIDHVLKTKPMQNMLFVFQPGEETGGGAELMIESKLFESFDIKSCYAIHVNDEFEEGVVASTPGVLFASAMEINVDFEGRASHIAFPHNGKNALSSLRMFLDNIEKLAKDPVVPLVVGIGKVTAGKVRNITPDTARIEGSIRGETGAFLKSFYSKLQKILDANELITGVKGTLGRGVFYPEVRNDSSLYYKAEDAVKGQLNYIDCGIKMTGEDFSFFTLKYPSCMFWLGTRTGRQVGLHHSEFLPDDSVIEKGITLFKCLLDYEVNNKNI